MEKALSLVVILGGIGITNFCMYYVGKTATMLRLLRKVGNVTDKLRHSNDSTEYNKGKLDAINEIFNFKGEVKKNA